MCNNLVCVHQAGSLICTKQSPRPAAKPSCPSSPLVQLAKIDAVTFSPMSNISPIKRQESHWSDQFGSKPGGVSAALVQLYSYICGGCFSYFPFFFLSFTRASLWHLDLNCALSLVKHKELKLSVCTSMGLLMINLSVVCAAVEALCSNSCVTAELLAG